MSGDHSHAGYDYTRGCRACKTGPKPKTVTVDIKDLKNFLEGIDWFLSLTCDWKEVVPKECVIGYNKIKKELENQTRGRDQ
jgi:hypothetical protein